MKSLLRLFLGLVLLVTQSSIFTQNLFAQTIIRQTISEPDNLSARLAAIEKAVEERRQSLGIPGLSLVIVKDDKVIFSKGFGLRNIEKKLPVTPDTLFAIGSSSKAFTSMAVVMSADEGKLSLDDSPKKFLPYFKLRDAEADANVTLRDLMSHRTGLDRTDFSLQFADRLTREDLIKVAGLAKPSAKFREKWQYQNTMFTAAGEAAARANQTTWEQLIPNKIFQPLGMKATNVSIFEMQKSPDFSLGYDYNPETGETRNVRMVDLAPAAPAGAINSNASDMAQWLKLLLGGGVFEGKRLVSEKNFNQLFTEQIQIAPKISYGLGWFVRDWQGKKVVEHGGNIDGFSAEVGMIPAERLGFAMLSNVTASALQNEIREIVWSNMLGEPEKTSNAKSVASRANQPPKISQSSTAATEISPALKEILGNYESERTGTPVDITFNGSAVLFVIKNQPHVLTVKSKDIFAIEDLPDDFVLSVKRDENGKINNLIFNQRDVAAPLRRVSVPADAPTIEDLMKKVVEAAGGEANLRKHNSMQMEATIDLENEGMTAESSIVAKAPNLSASDTKYFAVGKEVGTSFEYFDGRDGGSFATSGKSIVGTPTKKSGKFLEDARIAAAFQIMLDWKNLYQNVTIKKLSKIAGEDIYVVEKTPADGHSTIDYISTKTFRVLRRESAQSMGFGDSTVLYVENFSDFKTVDGVVLPFKIVSGINGANNNVTVVKSVKFNVDVPDSAFRPTFPGLNFMNNSIREPSSRTLSSANPADVASIDSIIAALYDVISGDAGKKRDWNRLRTLFVAEGKMIPLLPKREGGFEPRFLTVDGYVERSGSYIETNGFFESEISRKTEQFGNLAHVFSTYEGKHKLSDDKPFLRGINSLQLINDGKRWWIVNIAWDSERPGNLLPEKYLSIKK